MQEDRKEPNPFAVQVDSKAGRKRHDPALIKFAEVLFYEGRSTKEISATTGLPERIINHYAYSAPDKWNKYKEDLISLRRSKAINNILEAAQNYSKVLRQTSERLAKEIEEGKNLKVHEQKIVSEMIVGQVRAAKEVMNDPNAPSSQTNIQINLTKEEAEEVLLNDPAR